jgi:SAM-dependent MidA family methyltransferase
MPVGSQCQFGSDRWRLSVGRSGLNIKGVDDLIACIRAKIEADGPVSFAWFMEQALYHPQFGYYSSGRARIGRTGDYFTNVSVGPIYGTLVAAQLAEIWQHLGSPRDFVIAEQGGHFGEFMRDILTALKTDAPEFFDRVRCWMIEPFPVLRQEQALTLIDFETKVEWRDSLEETETFTGVHFSNELLDALPVHLVRRRETSDQRWEEKVVDWKDGDFVFTPRKITDGELATRLKNLPPLPASYETEVNLGAFRWIDLLSSKLRCGYVLTVDYGFPRDVFYSPNRATGTLQCRAHHQLRSSPLDNVGDCDITAHIEWTSIAERALERGFCVTGFADQHHFLTGILSAYRALLERADRSERRTLQTLLHPEMLGRSFQVLALSRAIEAATSLSGFQFARPPLAQLGIKEAPGDCSKRGI